MRIFERIPVFGNFFGSDNGRTLFDRDGSQRMEGAATVWDDINISLVAQVSASSTPAPIAFNGDSILKCGAFSGTNPTPDVIPSSLEILHAYAEGTDINLHVHTYPTTTDAGNFLLSARYVWFNRGSVVPAASQIDIVTASSGIAWDEHTVVFTLPGAGKEMGSRLVFAIIRDSADSRDTYAHDLAVTDVGVHYLKDAIGSFETLSKYGASL